VLTSIARLTGLLSAYLALLQVILLARVPALERLVGFDRLTVWHRWNGHACLDLVLAHVVFSVWGYALLDKITIPKEISTMLGGGIYPGMITATIGTVLLIAVVVTSVVIVKRRLRYEWWYSVHLLAYAGIALAWFHQIPTGNELVLDTIARTTGARSMSRRSSCSWCSGCLPRLLPRCATGCVSLPSSTRRRASSHCGSRDVGSTGCTHAQDSSSSGDSSRADVGSRRIRSRCPPRRTDAPCASASRPSAITPRR
jgi:Predicted ferric reductase